MEEFFKFFWLFVFGSFFGFLLETIWCMIRWRKIESRKGLIYGHLIPIYGLAGMFVAVIIELLSIKKKHTIFLVTFFIGAIVEYFSSLFQEKVTGTVSWDYSNMKYNLHGRINLVYLLGFGLFGIVWCSLYPKFLELLTMLFYNENIFKVITYCMFVFIVYDLFISLVAMIRQKNRRKGWLPKNKFEIWLDNKFPDEYLKKIYANSMVVEEKA